MTFKMERDIHYRLIKEIEPFPVLYNYNLPDYTNKVITDKVWSDVAKKTNITVGECKEKWRNIRSSYIRSKKAPPGRSRPKKIYYLARHLAFIEPFLKPRGEIINREEELEGVETDGQSQDCNFDVENSDELEDEFNNKFDTREEYIPNVTEPPQMRQPTMRAGKRRQRSDIAEAEQRMAEVEQAKKKERRDEFRGMSSHPMHYFFLSLLDEFETMDERQLREFKIKALQIIEEIKSKKPQASFGVSSPEPSFITFQASPAYASQNKTAYSNKKVPSSSSTSFVDNDSNITEGNTEDVDIYVKLEHNTNFE